jgi:hypothetical protein
MKEAKERRGIECDEEQPYVVLEAGHAPEGQRRAGRYDREANAADIGSPKSYEQSHGQRKVGHCHANGQD